MKYCSGQLQFAGFDGIAFHSRDWLSNYIPGAHKNCARVSKPFLLRAGDAIHPVLQKREGLGTKLNQNTPINDIPWIKDRDLCTTVSIIRWLHCILSIQLFQQVNLQSLCQTVGYKGEFVWVEIPLGPSQVSDLRISEVSTFQGVRLYVRLWRWHSGQSKVSALL